ncbi:hypothetical protein SBC1_80330 (plasmid) [Caballeronia sp. SBC1]|uniref:DUF262 domain-containing protein n=1 Tax=Caballeronia sp. SBC1 TaxID=2705548 RepID=UPI00140D1993|nr:DUF262 domain-containing protein [Caballeronia sp. SBC1]QIN67986.1 hypothetical protein SBC1_80330 [Caballeronia sp. SBC1]
MARIENQQHTINTAFRDTYYIVPDYQREYVWTDKEVTQLLDDINEQIDAGLSRPYFVGTVLVSPSHEVDHYEVIDGQQRLTTFFLLLCALKNLFRPDGQYKQLLTNLVSMSYTDTKGDIRTKLKLEPRYEHAGDVMHKLVEMDADPQTVRAAIQASTIPSFGSLENLIGAYSTIYNYLKDNYPDTAELKKYWGYLANNVVFIQISTDVSSALKIFETINERGVGLNPMDLLKNLLFTQVRQDEFTRLKDEWKKITKPLEQAKEKPLRFLRYFLMANYVIKNSRNDAVVREDEIYDWFVDKENAGLCGYAAQPFDFVRKVIVSVENYIAFSNGQGNDRKPSVPMENLKRLTGGAFSLHYVLLLAASGLPKALFDHFVKQLESFLFYYIFTKTPTKDLERSFSLWADELRAICAVTDLASQKAGLNSFVAERFETNMQSKAAELNDALKRFTLHSMQQYRSRYLVAKVTQYVEMAFQGTKGPQSLAPYIGLEIEHILPQTPAAELIESWTKANPDQGYYLYTAKLGNLTLLEKPINIVASNDFFAAKKAIYQESGNYLTRSLAGLSKVGQNTSITRINEKLAAFDTWDAKAIEDRQDMLVRLANEVWKTTSIDQ